MNLSDWAMIVGLLVGVLLALPVMALILASQGVLGLLLRDKPFEWERPL